MPPAARSCQVLTEPKGHPDAGRVTMLGLPPGMPWATIEATLRAAAPARD